MSSGDDDSNQDDSGHSPDSGEHKVFRFTIDNGEVTEVFEIKDGVPEPKPIDDDGSETYTVDGIEVVRTEVKPFGTEITRYADIDGDGNYNRISELWQSASDAPGTGHFKFEDNLSYSPSDSDDHIAVRGGEDCHGGQGADDFVIREAAHLRIADFNSSEDGLIIFDTGLGLISVDQLAGFVTGIRRSDDDQDFIVDFGPTASITLVGVPSDQISWDDASVLS
ncbi:MAG: hypothetical protein H0X02_02720 [Nitrosomonas sp.]|nr:hypothetical protein [Nitrosomonas sp.]